MQNQLFLSSPRVSKLLEVSPTALRVYLFIHYYSEGIIPVYKGAVSDISAYLSYSQDETLDAIRELYGRGFVLLREAGAVSSILIVTLHDDLLALKDKRHFSYTVRGAVWKLETVEGQKATDLTWNAYVTKLQLLFPKIIK